MFFLGSLERSLDPRRLAAAVLLLSVFVLPLHFHTLTATVQLSKECSCYQGRQTQVGSAPSPQDWTPPLQAALVELYEPQVLDRLSIHSHTIRAPPSICLS